MELLEGMTLLYSEHYDGLAASVFGIVIVVLIIGFIGWLVYSAIKEKLYECIWIALVMLLLDAGLTRLILYGSTPKTYYYILIDERVSFVEMVDKYGADNIKLEGGNVYKIMVNGSEFEKDEND